MSYTITRSLSSTDRAANFAASLSLIQELLGYLNIQIDTLFSDYNKTDASIYNKACSEMNRTAMLWYPSNTSSHGILFLRAGRYCFYFERMVTSANYIVGLFYVQDEEGVWNQIGQVNRQDYGTTNVDLVNKFTINDDETITFVSTGSAAGCNRSYTFPLYHDLEGNVIVNVSPVGIERSVTLVKST